jgi:pimeloyl-ACP methyl ester carboxylesterase
VRVEAGEAGIEYEVTGQGRPVILLHGFPDSGRLWRNQVPALADAGFRVIVSDLRGYGRSDKPAAPDSYSFPDPVQLAIHQLPGTTHHPTLNGGRDISAISPDYTATLTSWLNDVVTTAPRCTTNL